MKIENLKGENNLGIEIKYDMKSEETGNIYFEVMKKAKEKAIIYFPVY